MINSRQKGARGEREFAQVLRENGFDARRGQQFAGGADSPDVVSRALAWLHVEVKHVEQLNLFAACAQAERDAGGKPWIVAHRRNGTPWRVTMEVETFFRLLRGDVPPKEQLQGGELRVGSGNAEREKNWGAQSSAPLPTETTKVKEMLSYENTEQ